MKDMLSVIVPVYNAFDTIERCIDSLLSQKIDSYEIICIDDGSTDQKTPALLDQIAKRYPDRIQVFHTENSGVWNARKYGISKANGNYIGFCDCDDSVHKDMYKTMFDTALRTDADMTICGYHRIDYETNKIFSTEMVGWKDILLPNEDNLVEYTIINTALWNKIYKKSLLDKVIELDSPPRMGEDMMFLLSIYPYIQKIAFVDKPFYNYYVHKGSTMTSVTMDECNKMISSFSQVAKQMKQQHFSKEWQELVDIIAFIHIGISLPVSVSNNKKLSKAVQKLTNKELKANYGLWKHADLLKFRYLFRIDKRLLKVKIMQLVYRSGLFQVFLRLYAGMRNILKIDVKW